MSNKERAAELLIPNREWCKHHHRGEGGDPCGFCEFDAESGAQRLADAGLLAPDAPEPGVFKDGAEVEWDTLDGYVNVENGLIIAAHDERTEGDPPEKDEQLSPELGRLKFLNPAAAEEIGELLIAAAKYAKRGQR